MHLQLRLSVIWLGNDAGLGQLVLGCLRTHVIMDGMSRNTCRYWGKGAFLFSGVPSRYPSPLLLSPIFSYTIPLPSFLHHNLSVPLLYQLYFSFRYFTYLFMRIERFLDVFRLYSTSFFIFIFLAVCIVCTYFPGISRLEKLTSCTNEHVIWRLCRWSFQDERRACCCHL